MTVHRYPTRTLLGDYIRAAAGLAVAMAVLLSVPPSPIIVAVFGAVAVLFLLFGAKTLHRQITRVTLSDREIRSTSLAPRALPWPALEQLKLRYYGPRRQRDRGDTGTGFMELTLKGGGASMTLESSLVDFEYIAWRAARAARENGVSLDPTSAGNLLDLGIDADSERPAPGGGLFAPR